MSARRISRRRPARARPSASAAVGSAAQDRRRSQSWKASKFLPAAGRGRVSSDAGRETRVGTFCGSGAASMPEFRDSGDRSEGGAGSEGLRRVLASPDPGRRRPQRGEREDGFGAGARWPRGRRSGPRREASGSGGRVVRHGGVAGASNPVKAITPAGFRQRPGGGFRASDDPAGRGGFLLGRAATGRGARGGGCQGPSREGGDRGGSGRRRVDRPR